MLSRSALIVLSALSLAACNRGSSEAGAESEADAPVIDQAAYGQFLGTWAADCAQPFVTFEADTVRIIPDGGQPYPLTAATVEQGELHVSYEAGNGPYSEVYEIEGDSLRLVSGVYEGAAETWDKLPMQRCD